MRKKLVPVVGLISLALMVVPGAIFMLENSFACHLRFKGFPLFNLEVRDQDKG